MNYNEFYVVYRNSPGTLVAAGLRYFFLAGGYSSHLDFDLDYLHKQLKYELHFYHSHAKNAENAMLLRHVLTLFSLAKNL